MGDMHELERQILLKLIHTPHATFNELWSKQGASNTFAYHINKLESVQLIENNEGKYKLTNEGRKLSAFIEGDTGNRAEFPTLVVIMHVRKGDKYLCQKRLKEPFYGYWGFVGGKINFGQNIFECAKRDLFEEAGLHASDWKLKAIEQLKTFEKDTMIFHHYTFVVETLNPSGELKEKTHKAENAWLTLEEYKSKERFSGSWFFDHVVSADKPVIIEAERYMEEGKFIGSKLINIQKF